MPSRAVSAPHFLQADFWGSWPPTLAASDLDDRVPVRPELNSVLDDARASGAVRGLRRRIPEMSVTPTLHRTRHGAVMRGMTAKLAAARPLSGLS